MDPLVHAVVWSVGFNALAFVVVSSLTRADALERLQGALFVNVYRTTGGESAGILQNSVDTEDLYLLAQRILGRDHARRLFEEMARTQDATHGMPRVTDLVIARLERELAGSIGAASAHAVVTRITGSQSVGMTELIDIASETQELIETSRQLSEKSAELEQAAAQLRAVNERLRQLDAQKDEFLSQVSHELRTPMTSVRSFSEILLSDENVTDAERAQFVSIIHDESQRLTRLLDEILNVSHLEAGTVEMLIQPLDVGEAITAAINAIAGMTRNRNVEISVLPVETGVRVRGNDDRLRQALINLLSNAVKYNEALEPRIEIRTHVSGETVLIDVVDNGGGVSREEADTVFDKFARGSRSDADQGAGLGLTISRAIMQAMAGDLTVEFAADGTSFFRLTLTRDNASAITQAVAD